MRSLEARLATTYHDLSSDSMAQTCAIATGEFGIPSRRKPFSIVILEANGEKAVVGGFTFTFMGDMSQHQNTLACSIRGQSSATVPVP